MNTDQFSLINISNKKNDHYTTLKDSNVTQNVYNSIRIFAQDFIEFLNINLASDDFEKLLHAINFNINAANKMMMNTIKATKNEYIVFTQQSNINKFQRKELIKHLEFMYADLCDYSEIRNLVDDHAYKFNLNNTQKSLLYKASPPLF